MNKNQLVRRGIVLLFFAMLILPFAFSEETVDYNSLKSEEKIGFLEQNVGLKADTFHLSSIKLEGKKISVGGMAFVDMVGEKGYEFELKGGSSSKCRIVQRKDNHRSRRRPINIQRREHFES